MDTKYQAYRYKTTLTKYRKYRNKATVRKVQGLKDQDHCTPSTGSIGTRPPYTKYRFYRNKDIVH